MRSVKAFLLGAAAATIVVYVFVAALALVIASRGDTLELALGPILLVAVERDGADTVTAFGSALALVALAGGIVNGVAAGLIHRRGRGGPSDSGDSGGPFA